MLEEVEEEVLSHLVARALEESNTPEEAAGTFYKILGDLGIFLSSTAPSADNSDDDGKPSATTLAQSASFTCPVCYYERKAEEKFVTACPNKEHSLCYDCAEKYIQAHAQSGQADIGCFEQDCDHELEPLEIALVLGQGDAENGRRHTLYEQIIGMKTISSIATHPDVYATCPKERCGWTVARSRPGETEKATCGECDFDFCTNCRHEYHYRTSCIERAQLHQEWQAWGLTGRSEYWVHENGTLQKASKTAQECKRIEAVTKAEQMDEAYKIMNCRLCPHCRRLVQKIGGCNAMRCGYDTDTGGNKQDGCMKSFNWDDAPPYESVPARKHVIKHAPPPTNEKKKAHDQWKCDVCNEDICGLRFECINCASFFICEACDNNRNEWDHTENHIFRIHAAPK